MDEKEFQKMLFGEMYVKNSEIENTSKQLAELLYVHYTQFLLAGFNETNAFTLVLQMLHDILSRK